MEKQYKERICSFCGKEFEEGELFYSKNEEQSIICNTCTLYFHYIIKKEEENLEHLARAEQVKEYLLRPTQIKKQMEKYIVGQERAKKIVSVALYNHYKRAVYHLNTKDQSDHKKLKKSNLLMVGPSGSGKTLFVEQMARIMGVPYVVVNCNELMQSESKEEALETVFSRLIERAKGDLSLAQYGIVFLNEVDQITTNGTQSSQTIVNILETNTVPLTFLGNDGNSTVELCCELDTSNILFVCGGEFKGIEEYIKKRMQPHTLDMELLLETKPWLSKLSKEDLKQYGILPELLGQLQVLCTLEELGREAYLELLTKPEDSLIRQYEMLFEIEGKELIIEHEVLEAVVDLAKRENVGPRGLEGILEEILLDFMFYNPDCEEKEVRVTIEDIRDRIGNFD